MVPLLCLVAASSCQTPVDVSPQPFQITECEVGSGHSFRGATAGPLGWVATAGSDGQVWLGHNGHWTDASIAAAAELELRDIDVPPGTTDLYAMAAGDGAASALFRGDLILSVPADQSSSEGVKWTRVLSNPDPEGFFDAVAFDAGGLGLLVGDPINGEFTMFRSEDGDNWKRLARGRAPKAAEGEYAFAASGSILISTAPGQFWFTTGGQRSRIWRTDSGGAVWFDTGAAEVGGNESSGWFGLGSGESGLVLAVGGDYANPEAAAPLARWDEELGWETQPTALRGFRSAVCAVPGRAGHWVTVGSHGADWSADDGHTWQALPISGGHAVAAAGDGQVVVVGGANQPHRVVRFGTDHQALAK